MGGAATSNCMGRWILAALVVGFIADINDISFSKTLSCMLGLYIDVIYLDFFKKKMMLHTTKIYMKKENTLFFILT